MIVTANHWFRWHPVRPVRDWAQFWNIWVASGLARAGVSIERDGIDTPMLEAFVIHGQWLVRCPCGGAEKAWEEGYFICLSCLNAFCNHVLARSSFPVDREQIERLLDMRPLPNRNWLLGETLDDLKRENAEHNLGAK